MLISALLFGFLLCGGVQCSFCLRCSFWRFFGLLLGIGSGIPSFQRAQDRARPRIGNMEFLITGLRVSYQSTVLLYHNVTQNEHPGNQKVKSTPGQGNKTFGRWQIKCQDSLQTSSGKRGHVNLCEYCLKKFTGNNKLETVSVPPALGGRHSGGCLQVF